MARKILIYGVAFASLMCLTTFIYFENQLYKTFTQYMIVGNVIPLIILILGILFLNLSLRKNSERGMSVGRIGFNGMLFTAVVCIVWPVFYFAYTQKNPEAIENVKESIVQRKLAFAKANSKEIKPKEIEETREDLDKVFTQKMQIRTTIFMYFSIGILASSGLALLMGRKATEIAHEVNMENKENA